jgi:hypothetical protein
MADQGIPRCSQRFWPASIMEVFSTMSYWLDFICFACRALRQCQCVSLAHKAHCVFRIISWTVHSRGRQLMLQPLHLRRVMRDSFYGAQPPHQGWAHNSKHIIETQPSTTAITSHSQSLSWHFHYNLLSHTQFRNI